MAATLAFCRTAAEVWYADVKFDLTDFVAAFRVDAMGFGTASWGMEAVAIDSRLRTRSSGYVEPGWIMSKTNIYKRRESHEQTETIPAKAPDARRFGVFSSWVPPKVNSCQWMSLRSH